MVPSAGEIPRETTLWESLTVRLCESAMDAHDPLGSARRAIVAVRDDEYQAAYWYPLYVITTVWKELTLTSPSYETK